MGSIGVSSLPIVRNSDISVKGIDLNIMIAGSNGLGKTTFMNNFLGINVLKHQPFKEKTQGKYWYNEDVSNVQLSTLEIKELDFSTRMVIVEIDGIGDHVNNTNCYEAAVELLEDSFKNYEKKLEENVKALVSDKRIHLCFYMLEPIEDVKIADIEAMKAIGKHCNLIPIIGKSDLLKRQDIPKIKKMIKEQLDTNGITIFDSPTNGFEAPFPIISGGMEDGSSEPSEREYSWGTVDLNNSCHNEINKLRKFILEHSIINLKNETEFFYDNYRTSKLAAHLTGDGKSENNKGLLMRLEDYRKEIQEIKVRIKKKRDEYERESNTV